MSRPYTPYSTTRNADHGAGHGADRHAGYAADYAADYDAAYDAGYSEYEYPADYHEHLDRRWIWVAGVAGVILMVAVICTGVILGGGDSGSVSATATSADTATPVAPTTSTAASRSAVPPSATSVPSLAPETITTVKPTTPAPTASVAPSPAPAPAPIPAPESAPVDASLAARTITYQVTGNRQLLDLVTVIYTDQQGALKTDINVALPWVKTVTLDPGVSLSSVTATSITGQLNCAITDGNGTALVVQANNSLITTCTK